MVDFDKPQINPVDLGDIANQDSDDEFGMTNADNYVSFDEKLKFSEQLKKCSRE